MPLARFQAMAQDDAGNVLASPSVEVRNETGDTLASLFSDRAGTAAIANPFTGEVDGLFAFHVIGGAYKITVVKSGVTRIFRYVAIGTAAEHDADDVGGGDPSDAMPEMNGAAAPGVSDLYSRGDHVHPSDTSRAAADHDHTAGDITDFSEAVDDRVGTLLIAGTNIDLTYNDTSNTLTITSLLTGGGAGTGDVIGPTGAGAGNVALFDGATGKLLMDGGPLVAGGDVTGPAGAVDNRIAVFNGATGKVIKDGGILVSGLQPADAELAAIAGLTSAANMVPYFTGLGTAALTALTALGRTIIGAANDAAARAAINAQAFDAFLTSIATLGTAADKMIYTTGADTAAELDFPAASRTQIAAGLGTAAGKNTGASGNAVPLLDADNTWTGIQGYAETPLTPTTPIAWDVDAAPAATVALNTGATTMSAPTGVVAGRVYTIRFLNNATPGTVAWNTSYDFGGGSVPTITASAGAVDRFTFIGRAGNVLEEIGRSQAIA